MIRKILIFTVLAAAAAAATVLPLWKSDAAQPPTSTGAPQGIAKGRALLAFDIRLTGRDEFNDMDLSSTAGKRVAMQNARTRSRALAVDEFRSSHASEKPA